jgi:hypothetical protein
LVQDFERTAVKLLGEMNYDELRAELRKFVTAIMYGGFTQAPPEPSQSDLWRSDAKAQGWTDADFELLLSWGTREGAKITRLTWELAELSDGRTFTLRGLRLSQKSPTSPQTDDVWLKQFPPIRDPNAPAPSPTVVFSDGDGGGTIFSDGRHENHK